MFTENVDAFLDSVSGHALDATLDPAGAATPVKVILDAAYLEFEGAAGTNPRARGKAADFPASALGKQLTVGATTYRIRGREPVSDGVFVILTLKAG